MKKALLIGGTGFGGQHLHKLLEADYLVTSVGGDYDVVDRNIVEKACKLADKVKKYDKTAKTTTTKSIKAYTIGHI